MAWAIDTVSNLLAGYTDGTTCAWGPDGVPHVSWVYDSADMKYARKAAGVWTVETIGSASYIWAADMAIDSTGIVYVVYLVGYPPSAPLEAKLAIRALDGTWSTSTIYTPELYSHDWGGCAIAIDANDDWHVATSERYTMNLPYGGDQWIYVKLTSAGGTTTVAGDNEWQFCYVTPGSLACHGTDVHLLYAQDQTDVGIPISMWLKYSLNGGAPATLLESLVDVYTGGIAVDSSGNPHALFGRRAGAGYEMDYAKGPGWSIEAFDAANNPDSWDSSIALDADDVPHAVYHSDTIKVRHARKLGSTWAIEDIGGAASGQYCQHIDIQPGTSRIGIVFEDHTAGLVKFAYEVRAFSDLNQIF